MNVKYLLFMAAISLSACQSDVVSDKEEAINSTENESCLTEIDKQMLAAVNLVRSESRVCGDDTFSAVASLQWNCQLAQSAKVHSSDMANQNFFSHTGSDGTNAAQRIEAQGYNWQSVGENIAAGQSSVSAVMQSWLDSPGHCQNIMNGSFAELGAALVQESNSQYGNYWTQNFATPF